MSISFRYFKSSPEIIQSTVLLYIRYSLSLRYVEEILAERGIEISYETVRFWWNRFGPLIASRLRKRRYCRASNHSNWRWHIDEVFVKINGETRYLWRAVDHEGEVLDVMVTEKRDKVSAIKVLKRLMKRFGRPYSIVTDRLASYGAAMKEIGCKHLQSVGRWMNNRAENSHLVFRRREKAMNKFRSDKSLQKFTTVQSQIQNHFNGERHLTKRHDYLDFRTQAFLEWRQIINWTTLKIATFETSSL